MPARAPLLQSAGSCSSLVLRLPGGLSPVQQNGIFVIRAASKCKCPSDWQVRKDLGKLASQVGRSGTALRRLAYMSLISRTVFRTMPDCNIRMPARTLGGIVPPGIVIARLFGGRLSLTLGITISV